MDTLWTLPAGGPYRYPGPPRSSKTCTSSEYSGQSGSISPSGDFVVVWSSEGSYGTDTSWYSVQAQLFDFSGAPVGGQFQVNTSASEYEVSGRIAIDGQGNFVVVWGQPKIWGQRFSMNLIFTDGFESGDTSA